MRYPASEKLEVIRTVEGSHLPAKQTLDMLGIPRATFYRWYDRYVEGGFDALEDRPVVRQMTDMPRARPRSEPNLTAYAYLSCRAWHRNQD